MRVIHHYLAMLSLFLFGLILAGGAVADSAAGPEQVALRENSTVSSDRIRLKDVVQDADELPGGLGQLPLGNAPWAGRVRKVDPSLIELRLVSAGYDRIPFEIGGAEVCLVRRKTVAISSDEIAKTARQYLLDQLPDDADDLSVELLNDVHPVKLVDDGSSYDLRPTHRGSDSLTGRTRIKVRVIQDGKRVETKPVIFDVQLYRKVAVAAQSIAVSRPLDDGMVVWKRRDLGRVRGNCVTDRGQLKNKVANRTISPGQVMTHNMMRERKKPICVEPQQLVNLVVETRSMRIVVRGKALEQGRKGEWVKAMNGKTGEKVSGVVIGDGNIRVGM